MSEHIELENFELAESESFYSRVREQVGAENTLYNQRIIWLITMQAFLFATLGLILQSYFDNGKSYNKFLFDSVFLVISFSGIMIALVSNRVLNNARDVLDNLEEVWDQHVESIPESKRWLFPHPKGRKDSIHQNNSAIFRSGRLPYVFVFIWTLFIFVLLASKFIAY